MQMRGWWVLAYVSGQGMHNVSAHQNTHTDTRQHHAPRELQHTVLGVCTVPCSSTPTYTTMRTRRVIQHGMLYKYLPWSRDPCCKATCVPPRSPRRTAAPAHGRCGLPWRETAPPACATIGHNLDVNFRSRKGRTHIDLPSHLQGRTTVPKTTEAVLLNGAGYWCGYDTACTVE